MKTLKFKFITYKLITFLVGLFLTTLFVTNTFASDPAISVIGTFDARSQEVIVGQQNVPLMGFLTGTSGSDQTIKRFIIRFYADDDGSFDNNIGDQKASYFIASASLYDQAGALLSGPKPLRSFYAYDDVFFDSLEYKISANTQKKFLVKVNLLSANPAEKAYLAAGLIPSDITAEEDSTFNASTVMGNDVNQEATKDPVITVVKGGTMNIRAVPANPETTTIPATSSILNTFWPTVEYRFSP